MADLASEHDDTDRPAPLKVSSNADEHAVLATVLEALRRLDQSARVRIVRTIATFYDLQSAEFPTSSSSTNLAKETGTQRLSTGREPSFSDREDLSPKQFMAQKAAHTDIERVACLAYYLTHYRDTPHFKTIDISKVNTEAAQLKLSNASVAVSNASQKGLLASASQGNKQITSIGEEFVAALPDRDMAKKVLQKIRARRKANQRNAAGNKKVE